MLTQVQVTLISGDKFEFKNVVGLTFENDLLLIRGQVVGDEDITRAIFRKDLIKSVIQNIDDDGIGPKRS